MSDDLKQLLRKVEGGNHYGATVWYKNPDGPEAADRIEQLEEALHEWDALIRYQYSGSNEAMTALTEAAQYTAALLPGTGEWPGMTRMQQLEAALREIGETFVSSLTFAAADMKHKHDLPMGKEHAVEVYQELDRRIIIARAALGEKKDD